MSKDLTLTAAMAATLMGVSIFSSSSDNEWQDVVSENDTAVCVDQSGNRIRDDDCPDRPTTAGPGGSGGGRGSWFYMRRNSPVPLYGDSVHDARFGGNGSFYPQAGTQYYRAPNSTHLTRSQAVSRGGLGSGGRRYGGGWS